MIFTAMLNLIRSFARAFGKELKVTLTEHKIKLEFVDPDDLEDHAWDNSHFISGNLFLDGKANPVKPTREDDNLQMISSKRYKDYMKNKLVSDIVSAGKSSGLTVTHAIIILGGLQFTTIIAVVML